MKKKYFTFPLFFLCKLFSIAAHSSENLGVGCQVSNTSPLISCSAVAKIYRLNKSTNEIIR